MNNKYTALEKLKKKLNTHLTIKCFYVTLNTFTGSTKLFA